MAAGRSFGFQVVHKSFTGRSQVAVFLCLSTGQEKALCMYLRGKCVHKMFKKRWGGHKKARPRKEQAQRRKAKDGTRQLDPQQWQVQQNIGETTRQCMFCAINRQNFAADAPQTKRDGTGRRHLPTALGHNRTERKKGGGRKVEAAGALSPSTPPVTAAM